MDDIFNLFSDEPLPENYVPSERLKRVWAKIRADYIQFVTELETLTPAERQILIRSVYMMAETVDEFLHEQDELLHLSSEAVAQIEKSAVKKLHEAMPRHHSEKPLHLPREVSSAFFPEDEHPGERLLRMIFEQSPPNP